MYAIAGIIAPVFAIILLGAAARFWRVLDAGGLRGVNDVVFYLGIPSLLFVSINDAEQLQLIGPATLYFAVCFVIFLVAVIVDRTLLGAGLGQAGMVGLNACYGNTVMVGVPIITAAYGAEGIAIMLPIIALQSMLLLPIASFLIEAEGNRTASPVRMIAATVPALLRNPAIVSIVSGLLWRFSGLPLPSPLHRFLDMLGAGAPALALFALGASLPEFAARGNARETGLVLALKLVIQPLLVLAAAKAVGLEPLSTAVMVVVAGQPTGANAFFLARRTGVSVAASAGSVVVSTALSVITLSALMAWLS